MLIVSTLTQACANFDPRRAAGNQVLLFSCGGRADGGGDVTNSQLFTFNGGAGPLAFQPENQAGSCFTVKGNVLDVANCNTADPNQSFTFGGAAPANSNGAAAASSAAGKGGASSSAVAVATTASVDSKATTSANNGGAKADTTVNSTPAAATSSTSCIRTRRTVTVQPTDAPDASEAVSTDTAETAPGVAGGAAVVTGIASAGNSSAAAVTSKAAAVTSKAEAVTSKAASVASNVAAVTSNAPAANSAIPTFNPTTPVPVSGAGGTLNPTAVAEAQAFDDTAKRTFSNVTIRAPNGQCLFIDPTAGDFRENLIPVSLVDCSGSPNEKWDVVESGKHNNKPGNALIVSSLTQGCISFDGRRQPGDTVTLFSCGGRGDGSKS